MKVIQLLPTVSMGDAVSNDSIALRDILLKSNYETGIYAENIDSRLPKGLVKNYKNLPTLKKEDVIIYHLSTGTDLNELIKTFKCRKIMIYHNITPPEFFCEYNHASYELCKKGLEQAQNLKDTFDYVLAVSEFNKQDLIRMGYKCKIDILPILIKFDDYAKKPSKLILKKCDDGYTNIIFVGRIAPNKKQEDVIRSFYYYNKYYNEKSRLILVGSYGGMEKYYVRLKNYCEELGVKNVVFTGHIKFDEILAYYHVADMFLCMSEHEGFCVPLVESMYFDVPVIAYDSCAIGGTLAGSGVLLKEKNSLEVAAVMNYILTHEELKKQIVANEKERLNDFAHSVIETEFLAYLKSFIEKEI